MKKPLLAFLLGIIFTIVSFSLVLAKQGKVNIEGQISAVDEAGQTIEVQTAEGDAYIFHFPADYAFEFTLDDIGSWVHVKGEYQDDGTLLAEWVKPLDEEVGEEDGGKEKSAYCSGKKDKPHPAALFLAHSFNKEIEEIMGYFCQGFGFGQISLALQTEKVTGIDYGTLLARRADGLGWGEIWEELGYKGKPKDGEKKTPPGQEKQSDKDKDKAPKDDDEPKEKDNAKEKKPKKDKKPKKNK